MDDIEQNTRAENPNVQAERVENAFHALQAYVTSLGGPTPETLDDVDEGHLTDLIIDVMHLADKHHDTEGVVAHARAAYHYDAETGSELSTEEEAS